MAGKTYIIQTNKLPTIWKSSTSNIINENIMRNYLILLFFSLLSVSWNTSKKQNDLTASITHLNNKIYLLQLCFDMKRIKRFNFDTYVFKNNKAYLSKDTILIKGQDFYKNFYKLHNDFFIIENEKHQRKILSLNYLIFNNLPSTDLFDDFFAKSRTITKRNYEFYCVKKELYTMVDIKINANDKKIKFLYVSMPFHQHDKFKLIESNWVTL